MDAPAADRNGLIILDRAESLRLLATSTLGRVGLSMRSLPTVLPVNFLLDGDVIVLRTGAGSKLEAALEHAVVAFEVDQIDPMYHEGWSVVVTGVADVVTDPTEIARLETLPLRPWSTVPGDTFVTIRTELVSGRRLTRDRAEGPSPSGTKAPSMVDDRPWLGRPGSPTMAP